MLSLYNIMSNLFKSLAEQDKMAVNALAWFCTVRMTCSM